MATLYWFYWSDSTVLVQRISLFLTVKRYENKW